MSLVPVVSLVGAAARLVAICSLRGRLAGSRPRTCLYGVFHPFQPRLEAIPRPVPERIVRQQPQVFRIATELRQKLPGLNREAFFELSNGTCVRPLPLRLASLLRSLENGLSCRSIGGTGLLRLLPMAVADLLAEQKPLPTPRCRFADRPGKLEYSVFKGIKVVMAKCKCNRAEK